MASPLDETCRRFGISQAQLLERLRGGAVRRRVPVHRPTRSSTWWSTTTASTCSTPTCSASPLGLTPEEGLALVAAGTALLATPGADPDGPLARGLDKLAGVLGVRPGEDLGVGLGRGVDDLLTTIREARSTYRRIELDYYSHGRDERTTRTVDPWRLWSQAGHWYLAGYCHLAEGERVFRLDRIAAARAPRRALRAAGDRGRRRLPRARRAARRRPRPRPDARWLAESVPVTRLRGPPRRRAPRDPGRHGHAVARAHPAATGPRGHVVTLDPRLGGADLAAAAADRVLAAATTGSGRAG